jgi:mxaJ protein
VKEVAALALILLGVGTAGGAVAPDESQTAFRVCADPNNLPFSDSTGGGFENRIAALIASDLHKPLRYTWLPQRRGFVRNTLRAGLCDVVMGVPTSYELTARTDAYYRSTYVFVSRADRHLGVSSFDDAALRHLRIGVHMMGDDYANSPAVLSLLRRGLGVQLVGYMIYGDYSKPHPPSALIDAVKNREVDVAVVWGPLAGYFARRSTTPLVLTPVSPAIDLPFTPYVFDIALGVRRGDSVRRAALNAELARRKTDIGRILDEYGVPTRAVMAQ